MLGIEQSVSFDKSLRKTVIWSKSVQVKLPFYEQDKSVFEELGIRVERYDVKGNINRIEFFDYGVVKGLNVLIKRLR